MIEKKLKVILNEGKIFKLKEENYKRAVYPKEEKVEEVKKEIKKVKKERDKVLLNK